MSENVKIVKLSSGEEILAELVEENVDTIQVQNCLAIMLQPGSPGSPKMGFAFLPWGSLAVDDVPFVIKQSHVLYIADPVPEVVAHHKKNFSTLELPPQSGLVIAR